MRALFGPHSASAWHTRGQRLTPTEIKALKTQKDPSKMLNQAQHATLLELSTMTHLAKRPTNPQWNPSHFHAHLREINAE